MKPIAEAAGFQMKSVGEHSNGVEAVRTTYVGAFGKANVGISNDKECEMHSRRKTKVSRATLIGPGSVGT